MVSSAVSNLNDEHPELLTRSESLIAYQPMLVRWLSKLVSRSKRGDNLAFTLLVSALSWMTTRSTLAVKLHVSMTLGQ